MRQNLTHTTMNAHIHTNCKKKNIYSDRKENQKQETHKKCNETPKVPKISRRTEKDTMQHRTERKKS